MKIVLTKKTMVCDLLLTSEFFANMVVMDYQNTSLYPQFHEFVIDMLLCTYIIFSAKDDFAKQSFHFYKMCNFWYHSTDEHTFVFLR